MKFKKGDKVVMTENALENYGEKYRDIVFEIERIELHVYIRKAGERLARINAELKEKREAWKGEETFVI